MKTPRVIELVSNAKQLLCIGLASHIGTEEGNNSTSLRRAQTLVEWVDASGIAPSNAKVIAVPFGRAIDAHSNDEAAENAQRPAVIIGVGAYPDWVDVSSVYDELLRRSRLDTIDLARYSRAGNLKDVR